MTQVLKWVAHEAGARDGRVHGSGAGLVECDWRRRRRWCSARQAENFYSGHNTGTSFDANSQIYSRIVDFERGGTKVVPGLAEAATSPPTERPTPSICARA